MHCGKSTKRARKIILRIMKCAGRECSTPVEQELRYMPISLDVEESITMVSYECSDLVDCYIVIRAFIAMNDFT